MVQGIYMSLGQRFDFHSDLKKVTAPVLVIHGSIDLQPESASRQYAAAFPNAEFAVIPQAGHFPFEDHPQEFARIVGEFLKKL
jgi:pimeloyl-ACP methyl ester carboxylesterase